MAGQLQHPLADMSQRLWHQKAGKAWIHGSGLLIQSSTINPLLELVCLDNSCSIPSSTQQMPQDVAGCGCEPNSDLGSSYQESHLFWPFVLGVRTGECAELRFWHLCETHQILKFKDFGFICQNTS